MASESQKYLDLPGLELFSQELFKQVPRRSISQRKIEALFETGSEDPDPIPDPPKPDIPPVAPSQLNAFIFSGSPWGTTKLIIVKAEEETTNG